MTVFQRLLACFCFLIAVPIAAGAREPIKVSDSLRYELLAEWDVDRLNAILSVDTPKFAGIPVTYAPATNGVRLYRVTYASVVPEKGNRPIVATGLVAIPDKGGSAFPMVSYQHGTVYGKHEVPSYPEQSSETQLMIAQFAGRGYVVVGADYFGMGASSEPEGYMVKASHQQATFDMLQASRSVLAHMQLGATQLFLGGWSQGGFVTMAFLEKLEAAGVKVAAAATASAPLDVSMPLRGFLNFPRTNDATWVTSLFILTAFSFENYYEVPGLARSLITDEYYELARKAYVREPYDAAQIPTDLKKLVRAEYFDAGYFQSSAYGRIAAGTTAYRWTIGTPVRNYYGENDEVISVGLGQLAMTYQRAIGNGNTLVDAISTGPTSHRGTFATAVPQWLAWFDSLTATQ